MKRFSIVFALVIVILLGASVLAQTLTLSKNTEKFVKGIVQNKGINQSQIKDIKKVDMKNLPSEVNLKNIDNTNLQMYKIDLTSKKPVYVITVSEKKFENEIEKFSNRILLNFGFNGELNSSSFLNSAVGVPGAKDRGYVMIRDGSITGLSTNLEVQKKVLGGVVEVLIYKNGKLVGFRNTIGLGKVGSKTDYDSIEEGTINFEKGDIISTKVLISKGGEVSNINTLLEIVTKA